MPHFVVEYTSNIEDVLDLDDLFSQVHDCLIGMQTFPTGGIRSRANCIKHFRFADGKVDYAGLHVNLVLSATRTKEERIRIARPIVRIVRNFCAPIANKRPLAISMQISLFGEDEFFNHNNLHERFGDENTYPSTM